MHHTNKNYDYIIIGAGLSGIHLALELIKKNKRVLILEKSRNIGGRIANRRFLNYHFALGLSSFQASEPDLSDYAQLGLSKKQLDYSCSHYFTKDDVSIWSKSLIEKKYIHMSTTVERFIKTDFGFKIITNKAQYVSEKIIITAPSMQTYDLLKKSGRLLSELKNVEYSKDIFYYCRTEKSISLKDYSKVLEEAKNGFIYTKFKANEWNELSREDIKLANNKLIKPLESHAHKWRYSRVTKTMHPHYQLHFSDLGLYLAGDYFFGDDLNAAIKSANYLLRNF